jgi:hypothetical protein
LYHRYAALYKAWIGQEGNLHTLICDICDFRKIKPVVSKTDKLNNQMYDWQVYNNIENYFVLIFVKI